MYNAVEIAKTISSICEKQRGKRQVSALLKECGLTVSFIDNMKKGCMPSTEKLAKVAKALNVPIETLLGVHPEPSIIPLDNSPVSIPVYESVSAGLGAYADNKIVGYTSVYLRNVNIGEIIAAKVVGDSMYPHICNGDTVIIRKNAEINNGDVAVILIDDEAVVKKVKFEPDKLTLISFNPEYQDRVFTANEAERIKFVGKVISSQKNW